MAVSTQRLFVVTGGGSGIGAETVRALRERGDAVIATGRREGVLQAIAKDSGCDYLVSDITKPADNEALAVKVSETGLQLGGLVHAAGIMESGGVAETTLDSWHKVLETNLTGPFDLTRHLLPKLRVAGGSIVMVASVAADRAPAGIAAYAVSKAGLSALSNLLAVEEGRGERPVRCNTVNPGWTRSEMADKELRQAGEFMGGLSVDEAYAEVTKLVPLGRPARTREVANVIAWLLSPEASYVNGATVAVDGGQRWIDAGVLPIENIITPR
ncbi:MAG: SDR family oxidoreductase [Actinomycetota bacterium]